VDRSSPRATRLARVVTVFVAAACSPACGARTDLSESRLVDASASDRAPVGAPSACAAPLPDGGGLVDGGGAGFQSGSVYVAPLTDPIDTIVAGRSDPYLLRWTVISRTRLPATYRFNPVVWDIRGASENLWNAGITLSDVGPVELQPFAPRVITMSVRVPAAAVSARLSLRAASADNSLQAIASAVDLIAGAAPEVSDPRVLVRLQTIPARFQGAANPLAATACEGLTMRPSASSEIPFEFSFPTNDASAPGSYRYRARVEGQTARWTLGAPNPTGQDVVVLGNAPAFRVPITSTALVDTSTTSFIVVYAERFVGGATEPTLRSLVRIPIVGRE
jgi:hypothetical protein